MIEFEKSYIFTVEDGEKLLSKYFNQKEKPLSIADYYHNKNLRTRCCDSQYSLCRKTGDKASGKRIEQEAKLSAKAAEMLWHSSALVVKKQRHTLVDDKNTNIVVTLDFIEKPLRLCVLEIESTSSIGDEIVPFGLKLKKCPLAAWDFFRRKIGICGAPSSGKSSVAQLLTHTINTKFGGSAFHVTEYATSFIQKYQRHPNFYDQFFIWHGQHSREIDASRSNIVVSDCPTFLSFIYMQLLNKVPFGQHSAMYLSKIYKRVLRDTTTYSDIVFLRLLDYTDNNIRYQTRNEAIDIEKRISTFLSDHRVRHMSATYQDVDKILDDIFYINREV